MTRLQRSLRPLSREMSTDLLRCILCIGILILSHLSFASASQSTPLAESQSPIRLIEPSQFVLGKISYSDSDKTKTNTLSLDYRNHRRDLYFPYAGEVDEAFDWGLSFGDSSLEFENLATSLKRQNLNLLLAQKLSLSTLIEIQMGYEILKDKDSSRVFLPLQMTLSNVNAHFLNRLTYGEARPETLPALALSEQITRRFVADRLTYLVSDRLRWIATGQFDRMSDENQKTQFGTDLMYGLLRSDPWFWAGLGYEELSYLKNKSEYWSPRRITSYGLRLEAASGLFSKISANLGLSLNKFHDLQEDRSGDSSYLNAGLQYGDRNQSNFKIQIIQTRTEQNASSWGSQQVSAAWNLFF